MQLHGSDCATVSTLGLVHVCHCLVLVQGVGQL
jgi:hypothetical protein